MRHRPNFRPARHFRRRLSFPATFRALRLAAIHRADGPNLEPGARGVIEVEFLGERIGLPMLARTDNLDQGVEIIIGRPRCPHARP
jgi:hypothetical protein